MVDDFEEVVGGGYQVCLGCHQPHVLLLPRLLLLIPAPSRNSLSLKPLNPSHHSHSPSLPQHTARFQSLPTYPRRGWRMPRQKKPSQLLMARVPWPDCCCCWWRVQLEPAGRAELECQPQHKKKVFRGRVVAATQPRQIQIQIHIQCQPQIQWPNPMPATT